MVVACRPVNPKGHRLFWSKPTPPPAPPPPSPEVKPRHWGFWLLAGFLALSVAAAGCKDRRLLDGTGTSTTAKKPSVTTAKPGATTVAPPVETAAPTAPTTTVPMTDYVIAAGDTMSGIAKKFGVTMQALLLANNLTDPNLVRVGQKIKVPVAPTAVTTVPPVGVTGTFPPGAVTVAPVTQAPAPTAKPAPTTPTTIDDGSSPQTSIVTITVIVTIPRTTVKP
jgi:LysM repeat protein